MNKTESQRAEQLSALWEANIKRRRADQIKSAKIVEVELPSGTPVMAVRVNIMSLIEAGRIPDALTPFVMDAIVSATNSETDQPDEKASEQFIRAHWGEWLTMLDHVWMCCVVAPKFTLDFQGKDGAIPVRMIEVSDKTALFNWAQGVSDHLAAFRQPAPRTPRTVVDEPGVPEVHAG